MNEGSARRKDLYLYNTQHSQKRSMPRAGFEPAIPAKRMQTYALERPATGIGPIKVNTLNFKETQWEDVD